MNDSNPVLWSLNFVSACIANFLMGFSFYLLMPTLPFYLIGHFAVDKGMVGAVMSCYVIAALLVRPFSGYMVDTFARKPVYMISFIFFVALTAGYLIAGAILLMIILRFWHGITWGIITTAGNTLAIDVMPSERRGEGIGYYGLALNLSMAIGPMVGLFLYDHYTFNIIFYTSIVSGTIGLIFASFIKAPVHTPIKHQALSLDRFFLTNSIPIGINLVFISLSYGMVLSFAAMYGKERGVTHTGMYFTLMAIGMAVSRIFSGKMIDKGKIKLATILGIIILSVGFIALTFCVVPMLYFAAALTIGVGYGVLFPSFQTLFINLGTHHQRGTANSTFYTAFDLGVGIGMLVAGQIAAVLNLSYAFGLSALGCIVAMLFFLKISSPYYDRHKVVQAAS
jgi:MFS family permease